MKLPRINRYIPKDTPVIKGMILRGLCDYEEKAIYINPKQSDKERLITACHESTHYLFPSLTEKKVEEYGCLIGEVLWRLGYRSRIRKKRKASI
jgi:hypothetical protein